MPAKNPYTNKKMLSNDSDMFFDRKNEINSIVSSLLNSESPPCVSISGERRIGKSSLAFRVFHNIMNFENIISIYVDCSGLETRCNSEDEFFQELNTEFLKNNIKDRLSLNGNNLFNSHSSFKRFIEKQRNNTIKFIIFLDEFDYLATKDFANPDFFLHLRSLFYNPDNKLAFVTISHKSLKLLVHSSIFWNPFDPKIIGLLDDYDINGLRYIFEKNDLSLKENESKMIDNYAGKCPFLNQVVCEYIFESKVSNFEVDKNELELKLLPHYEDLWKNRSKKEQKLLKTIIKKRGVIKKEDYDLKEMVARGLLIKKNENYYPFSNFFSKLIKNHFKIERSKPTLNGTIDVIRNILRLIKEGKETLSIGNDEKE